MSRWDDFAHFDRIIGRHDLHAVVPLPTRQTGRRLATGTEDDRGLGTYLAMCPPSRLAMIPEMCPLGSENSPASAASLEMCPPTLLMPEEEMCLPSSDASSSNVDECACRGCHDGGNQPRDDLRCSLDVDPTCERFVMESVQLAVGDSECTPTAGPAEGFPADGSMRVGMSNRELSSRFDIAHDGSTCGDLPTGFGPDEWPIDRQLEDGSCLTDATLASDATCLVCAQGGAASVPPTRSEGRHQSSGDRFAYSRVLPVDAATELRRDGHPSWEKRERAAAAFICHLFDRLRSRWCYRSVRRSWPLVWRPQTGGALSLRLRLELSH